MPCEATRKDRGVTVRCINPEPHPLWEHVFQTPTQACEAAVRAIVDEPHADVGIRWAGDKIVGILCNGRPIGPDDWKWCSHVLPIVPWDGPPKQAWLISQGKMFRCNVCKNVVPASRGADDDMPEACDACRKAAHPTTATCAECGSPLDSSGDCPRALGFRSTEEQHGATLAAHCGAGPWEGMFNFTKRVWIKRAKRLRARWEVDEMTQRLNEATDCTANLRSALCGEPEWTDPTLGLYDGAAHALRRLRSEAAHLACLAKTAREELVAVRDAGQEWRSLAEGFEERALAASAVVSSAKNLVDAWERHGLSGLASQMYDLRSALEKAK